MMFYILQKKVREVAGELGLNLVTTSTYHSWEYQIYLMRDKNVSTLNSWYGPDIASAFIKYKNGELGKLR